MERFSPAARQEYSHHCKPLELLLVTLIGSKNLSFIYMKRRRSCHSRMQKRHCKWKEILPQRLVPQSSLYFVCGNSWSSDAHYRLEASSRYRCVSDCIIGVFASDLDDPRSRKYFLVFDQRICPLYLPLAVQCRWELFKPFGLYLSRTNWISLLRWICLKKGTKLWSHIELVDKSTAFYSCNRTWRTNFWSWNAYDFIHPAVS